MKKIYLLAISISMLYAFTIFDLNFILGRGDHWNNLYGDIITNIIGSLYFARDHWRWPLFYVPNLAFPEGTSIIFTDSIPLLALVMKFIYKISGHWFNYFGVWLFSCFILLGFFISLCIKECQFENPRVIPISVIGAVLLALSSPALLNRFGHAALMAHFLPVWAFYAYLKFKNDNKLVNFTIQFMLMVSLCILLQTYFLLMVMPFYVAALLQHVLTQKNLKLDKAVISFVFVITTIFFISYTAGIIGPHSPKGSLSGFGYFSMNFLSPFLPPREHLPLFIAQHVHWDGNGYTWDATGGQYEGYNYLGAGILILLLANARNLIKHAKPVIKEHLYLFLALMALCLLALSGKIYIGDLLILKIHGGSLFSFFRTSGRLFWPIYYVLVVLLIYTTYKKFSFNIASCLILIAVVFQLMDTQLLRNNMLMAEKATYPQVLSHASWDFLLENHQFLEQYPSFQCGGWGERWPDNNSNLELLLLAAKQNKPTNSAYLARTSRNCFQERDLNLADYIKPNGLYVFGKNYPLGDFRHVKEFDKWCREFSFGFVCTKKMPVLSSQLVSSEFKLPAKFSYPIYKLGEVVEFKTNGQGLPLLYSGWYSSETWGTWSKGQDSKVIFKTSFIPNKNYFLNILARGFVYSGHPIKKVDVMVNGKQIAQWSYVLGNDTSNQTVEIPTNLIKKDGIINITFHYNEVKSLKELGLSDDARQLSFALVQLSIA